MTEKLTEIVNQEELFDGAIICLKEGEETPGKCYSEAPFSIDGCRIFAYHPKKAKNHSDKPCFYVDSD